MTSNALPNPVHWSEGMLLSPQHLQQHDIAWQARINHRFASTQPNARGVRRLVVDRESLAKGIVRVTALECLLDDGHPVLYPGDYSTLELEADVAALCRQEGRPVRIWVALLRRGIDGATMTAADKRYDLLPAEMTSDENLDNSYQVPVVRMQARIRLIAGHTVPPQYAACPLLDVELDAQGRFRLTDYHPPMLQVAASSFHDTAGAQAGLQTKLETLAAGLWVKLRELAGNPSGDSPDDYGSGENERRLWTARHLAACLPQFEIAMACGASHPETLYRALAQVVGQVAAIGSNPVPLKMEAYAHDDCMPQFQRAIEYIEGKLKLVDTAFDFLEFRRVGDAGFSRTLPAHIDDEVLVELKTRDGQSAEAVAAWLSAARASRPELMIELRKRRMTASVRVLKDHEIQQRKLPAKTTLFAIRNDRIEIEGKGSLSLFSPDVTLLIEGAANERMPAAIVLYAGKTGQAAARPAAAHAAHPYSHSHLHPQAAHDVPELDLDQADLSDV